MSRRFMSKWANLNFNKTRRLYKIGYWACSIYCKDLLILVWQLGANFCKKMSLWNLILSWLHIKIIPLPTPAGSNTRWLRWDRLCNLCCADYQLFTADGNSLASIPGQPLTRMINLITAWHRAMMMVMMIMMVCRRRRTQSGSLRALNFGFPTLRLAIIIIIVIVTIINDIVMAFGLFQS